MKEELCGMLGVGSVRQLLLEAVEAVLAIAAVTLVF